jgi:hypothetical protein
VGLSGTVTTITLGLVAGSVAIYTFVLDRYDVPSTFWPVGVAAIGCLGASAYYGGRGVSEIASNGKKGEWPTTTTGRAFAKQTGLALLGAVLLLVGITLGTTAERRSSGSDRAITLLAARSAQIDNLSAEITRLTTALDSSRETQSRLSKRLARLERASRRAKGGG